MVKSSKLTLCLYKNLIESTVGNTYCSIRLRIMIFLLTLTGLKIDNIRYLKTSQIEPLRKDNSISFESLKQKEYVTTIHLTEEGKKLFKEREKDFNYLFFMRSSDSYIFTSESNYNQPISRETFTKDLNKVLQNVSKNLANNSKITSYSFKSGYISELWKNQYDLKLVQFYMENKILIHKALLYEQELFKKQKK